MRLLAVVEKSPVRRRFAAGSLDGVDGTLAFFCDEVACARCMNYDDFRMRSYREMDRIPSCSADDLRSALAVPEHSLAACRNLTCWNSIQLTWLELVL